MENIVETFRLFRRKEDDIWALFIMEFLKLIGCIVFDYELPSNRNVDISKITEEFCDNCDVNILWNFHSDEKGAIERWKKESGDNTVFIIFGEGTVPGNKRDEYFCDEGKQIFLTQIINKVWGGDTKAVLNRLLDNYVQSDLFFYWYHRGSLKFVQEYYPLDKKDRKIQEKREKVYVETFCICARFYNTLLEEVKDGEEKPYYYQYALVNLQNELNCLEHITTGGHIFEVKSILKEIMQIRKNFPDYIRIEFLEARVSQTDNRFLWDAEVHYLICKEKFKKKYGESRMGDFLYYKLGKYYEKKLKDYKKAEDYYRQAYECNPRAYRALFKIAKAEEQRANYENAVTYANEIIRIVLNGFTMDQLMPRRQIYIYKTFVLLGDTFIHLQHYISAVEAYRRALEVSGTRSCFYQTETETFHKKMRSIIKACMPKQPVYLKLISVASKLGNTELIEKYYSELLTGDEYGEDN